MDDLEPVFEALATYFSMLAEPTRLRILRAICEGERPVGEIVELTGIGQTNVSRHLALMHRHGVVARRRAGTLVYYRLADATMLEICSLVCERIARTLDAPRPLRSRFLQLVPAVKRHAA